MTYTINQIAQLAHISVRTLHHYDAIELLKPAYTAKNGYRHYEKKELLRLQQILFFRELDFPLNEIKKILDDPKFDMVRSLNDQKRMIEIKKRRLSRLIITINKTINSMTNDKKIKDEELYDPFRDDDVKQFQDEVKERWGDSDAYKVSMAKVKKMTKQEMDKLKVDGKKFTQSLADSMDKGYDHPDVQALIAQHHKGIEFFYPCPLAMYRNLGQMYVDDPRFTAYYDRFRPGLALFLRDAVAYYCNNHAEKK